MIFAAGPGKRGRQLGVTEGPAQSGYSADDPESDQGKVGSDTCYLKSKTGKNAGADHVRYHKICGRQDGDFLGDHYQLGAEQDPS